MPTEATTRLFGRVENWAIVEFPVTVEMLAERPNAASEVYIEAFYDPNQVPVNLPLKSKIVESPRLIGPHIFIDRIVVDKTIQEMFDYLFLVAGTYDEVNGVVINHALITPEIYAAFYELVKKEVQVHLDRFAQERGYDGIVSLCSYKGSNNLVYGSEASYAMDIRDDVWHGLTTYFNGVQAGTSPVPLSFTDILSHIPEMSWDNMPS